MSQNKWLRNGVHLHMCKQGGAALASAFLPVEPCAASAVRENEGPTPAQTRCQQDSSISSLMCTVALQEIRKFQKSTDLLLHKLPFTQLVCEITQDYNDKLWFHAATFVALQEAAEEYIVGLMLLLGVWRPVCFEPSFFAEEDTKLPMKFHEHQHLLLLMHCANVCVLSFLHTSRVSQHARKFAEWF